MMDDKELHAFCESWYGWCMTRRFFVLPGSKNILARMQPSKVLPPPNAELSAELNYFNQAVHAVADMGHAGTDCFAHFYCRRTKNVKAIAASMGISRQTFYERAKAFARAAYSLAKSLQRGHLVVRDDTLID